MSNDLLMEWEYKIMKNIIQNHPMNYKRTQVFNTVGTTSEEHNRMDAKIEVLEMPKSIWELNEDKKNKNKEITDYEKKGAALPLPVNFWEATTSEEK